MDKINQLLESESEELKSYQQKMTQLKLSPAYVDFLMKITQRQIQQILLIQRAYRSNKKI